MGAKPRRAPIEPVPRAERLRLVTINFWGIEPPLDTRLELAIAELLALDLDVVCMQEVRPLDGRTGRNTADVMADALGMTAHYRVALEWNDGDFFAGHPGGSEGLAILSRAPVLDIRRLELPDRRPTEGRILLSAQIDHPIAPVWIHTTHLHYRLDDGLARERQVMAVDAVLCELDANPQILCGDFNAPPDADEIRFLRGACTLGGRRTHYQDAWLRVHPGAPGLTWSAENELTRPLRSLDINRRIDYVFVTTRRKDGRGTVCDARVILDRQSPEGIAASDHFGVLADVRVAPAIR